MTFYVATTEEQFEKISAFLNAQPEDSLVRDVCWRGGGYSKEWFIERKKRDPPFDVYYVEDRKGEIRVVWAYERRGFTELNEPKLATMFIGCMRHEDFERGHFEFLKELWVGMFEENLKIGINRWEIAGLEQFFVFAMEIFGEAITIRDVYERPYGRVYYADVDVVKAFELIRR